VSQSVAFPTWDADWSIDCDWLTDCDWSAVESSLSLASWFWFAVLLWFPDSLIDCVTLASPNACCDCGIEPLLLQ
jgi:hypothetical protein